MVRHFVLRAAFALLASLAAGTPGAATLRLAFDYEFSGGVAPAGAAPWFVATFEDVAPGKVRLTMSVVDLSCAEFISSTYFNLDPGLSPANLGVRFAGGVAASQVTGAADCCKADGGGYYDLRFSYSAHALGVGTESVYLLSYSGTDAFGARSFAYLGAPSGGHGPFYAAAHAQDTAEGGSGWIAPLEAAPAEVALPAPLGPLAVGLAAVLGVARLRPRQA
jgi:hypothetical protein